MIALIVWIVADAANPPRPQEVDGFNDFRADAKKEFGDQVYGLLVYEGYAFVEVPVAGGNHRSAKYSWRGDGFEDWTKNSGVTAPLFDIDDVDPVLFGRLCDEVRAVIDDGKDCYVSVEGPSGGTASEVGIRASISNDFSESASVTATLDGTIIDRYPPEE